MWNGWRELGEAVQGSTCTVTLTGGHLPVSRTLGGLKTLAMPSSPASPGGMLTHEEAEPLAKPYYGQTITVNFDPKKAYASKCSN